MKLKDWLGKWHMDSLKINAKFLELELKFEESDRKAAWELYIELITRTTTQRLTKEHGNELAAIDSVYQIFPLTRQIIKENGRNCIEFTKIAIVVLNQVIRPFTTKWHKLSLESALQDKKMCKEFRKELAELQDVLRKYTQMLSEMAGVEDLTDLLVLN
jgi:hypothetical protein